MLMQTRRGTASQLGLRKGNRADAEGIPFDGNGIKKVRILGKYTREFPDGSSHKFVIVGYRRGDGTLWQTPVDVHDSSIIFTRHIRK